MTTLKASAIAHLPDAEIVLEAIHAGLRNFHADSDPVVSREGATVSLITSLDARIVFSASDDSFVLHAEADNLDRLITYKNFLAAQLLKYAEPHKPSIRWRGDGSELAIHPYFRLLRLVSAHNVTPHMRRLTLAGDDLDPIAAQDGVHVLLMIPREQDATALSMTILLSPDGRMILPRGDNAPHVRDYTIRSVDLERGTLDIDFVIHDDAGPGSTFAEQAKAGDVIGFLGRPGLEMPVDRNWYLFAGDETALPAIARILEAMPKQARGLAFIEVADAAEEQEIITESGIEISWLHRNGATAGTTDLLVNAVRGVNFPPEGTSLFIWTACEYDAFKKLRAYLRKDCGFKKGQTCVASQWRRGEAGE